MSVSEKWMWARLLKDKLGFRFRRQFPVGPYVLDFYCVDAKICIEVDGELHCLRSDRDAIRDQYLADQGIYVLRVPSQDLFDDENPLVELRWMESIEQLCIERTGREQGQFLKPKVKD